MVGQASAADGRVLSRALHRALRRRRRGGPALLGDNHAVLRHLLRDYRGAVDLIYIDPPYNSGAAYTQTVRLRGDGRRQRLGSAVTTTLCPADAYLQFLYERLLLARELLADTGRRLCAAPMRTARPMSA